MDNEPIFKIPKEIKGSSYEAYTYKILVFSRNLNHFKVQYLYHTRHVAVYINDALNQFFIIDGPEYLTVAFKGKTLNVVNYNFKKLPSLQT
jgi:hypothetical protein